MEHSDQASHERRHEPRYSANLRCTIMLPSEDGDIQFPDAKLECRTRDLSETGVGLTTSSIYLGYTCILDEGRILRVALEIGGAVVEMSTTAVHYVRLDDGDEPSYQIGLRILEITGSDVAGYLSCLNRLSADET